MPRLLLEYKGRPGIFNHNLSRVDDITFITVFINEDNTYERKDFKNLDEAMGYRVGKVRLVFVYIQQFGEEYNYIQYANITNLNKISNSVEFIKNDRFTYRIEFSLNRIWARKISSPFDKFSVWWDRRAYQSVETDKVSELYDSFYELIPRFEDVFLETLFVYHVLENNYINSQEQLEAFMLQEKFKIEMQKSPIKKHEQIENEDNDNEELEDSELSIPEGHSELINLIGLDKVKLEIQELKSLAQFRKKRIEHGLPVTPSTLHMVFTGNPGTGKTTVARLLGQIYNDIGLLSSNKVVEVSRTDLVGEFVGHTAPKTQKVFEKALGGILFIDEAYSLFKNGVDFGSEAVETLLKLMEDHREKIVVIIAGYPKEIEDLLVSNPGLKSRFSKFIHFDDYSRNELFQIFEKMVKDYGNNLTTGAKNKIEQLIHKNYESGYFSSNARAIRNVFEQSVKKQSSRLALVAGASRKDISTFIDKDIPTSLM